jgi:tripeptide aminopeptidase
MARIVDESDSVRTVMNLLRIEGTTGRELAVVRHLRSELLRAGVAVSRIRMDRAFRRFPMPAQAGNLMADIPGRGALAGAEPRLFCAHMDTVGLAAGARPRRRGRRIVAAGRTALGADDRSGCGVLLTLARTLRRTKADHRPLVLLFTAAEETGLWGSRYAEARLLKKCEMGFSYDGGDPAELVVAAPSSDKFTVVVRGRASHAGVHPEKGVSAAAVFAEAHSRLADAGWLGRVDKGRQEGTANIGMVRGGEATNVVMAELRAEGEARSYSARFLTMILKKIRSEFERAAKRRRSSDGRRARVSFARQSIYRTFDLGEGSPVVAEAARAVKAAGLRPKTVRQFGGLDANWLNAHGLPTVTLGTGAHDPHQVGEWLDVREYVKGCEVAVRLATAGT